MVLNNPLAYMDPDGHCGVVVGHFGGSGACAVDDATGDKLSTAAAKAATGASDTADSVTNPQAYSDRAVSAIDKALEAKDRNDVDGMYSGAKDAYSNIEAGGAIAVLPILLGGFDTQGPEAEGVVYLRTNPETQEEYVGQSKNEQTFDVRQDTHDRNEGVKHDYKILQRAKPGAELDKAEEDHIRLRGGPKRKGGRLANKRYQMNDGRYKAAGGKVPKPTSGSKNGGPGPCGIECIRSF